MRIGLPSLQFSHVVYIDVVALLASGHAAVGRVFVFSVHVYGVRLNYISPGLHLTLSCVDEIRAHFCAAGIPQFGSLLACLTHQHSAF